jgi:hypothetical protein
MWRPLIIGVILGYALAGWADLTWPPSAYSEIGRRICGPLEAATELRFTEVRP